MFQGGASSSASGGFLTTGGLPPPPGLPRLNLPAGLTGLHIPPPGLHLGAGSGLGLSSMSVLDGSMGGVPPGLAAAMKAGTLPSGLLRPPMMPPGFQMPGGMAGLAGLSGMPGMLRPPLPMPPMPPGVGGEGCLDWQRTMMLMQNPDLAGLYAQQEAIEYEQANMNNIEPEVIELASHFKLDNRMMRMLDEQLKKRRPNWQGGARQGANTFEDDIAALYQILKGAKNPADLLMVSIKQMAEGRFFGTNTPDKGVADAAKKYKLDAPAAMKLAEVLELRDDPAADLKKICKHLERSSRPSALVMMMLKDLKNGVAVKDPTHAAAVGSFAHEQELRRGGDDKDKRRSRSRGRGGGGGRSRSRGCGGRGRGERDGGDRGGGRGDRRRSFSPRREGGREGGREGRGGRRSPTPRRREGGDRRGRSRS